MPIRNRLKAALQRAMKARASAGVALLRSLLAAIDNAEAVDAPDRSVPISGHSPDVPRRHLSEAQMRAIVQREIDAHRAAIADYERLGRSSDAARLRDALREVTTLLDA